MLVSLKVPDEVYEVYAKRNPSNPRLELERTLLAYQDLDPKASGLVLTAEELGELGKLFSFPISDARSLIDQVKRSQRVSLGEGVELTLNPGQRARLKAQADFFNRSGSATPEEFATFVKTQVGAGIVAVVGP